MSYQQTTASDSRSLMTVIRAFANSDSWTTVYNDIVATGQFGIEKSNCHLSMGEKPSENPVSHTDQILAGTVYDALVYMVVNHSLNSGTLSFWNQPSSIVTTSTDADRVSQNDVNGAFTNVWLFSDAVHTYIWVVTQQSGDRFNVFGFGNLDKRGMSHPDVGFCVGSFWEWWAEAADYSANSNCRHNRPDSGNHVIGLFNEGNVMCFLPDGVVDPVLGFPDGAFQIRNNQVGTEEVQKILTRGDAAEDHQTVSSGEQLDYFLTVDNQLTTGGIPLASLEVRYRHASSGLRVFLGNYPGIRLVNMSSLVPGQEINFGSEVWKVFPLKRKGSRANVNFGTSPQPYVNSIDYGFAIRKIV